MKIFAENLGAPKSPLFDGANINPDKPNPTVPQAWSMQIQDEEYWYYNYLGALTEAEFRGARLPTWDELKAAILEFSNSEIEVEKLKMPAVGMFRALPWGGLRYERHGMSVLLWTTDLFSFEDDPCLSWDGDGNPPELRDCLMIDLYQRAIPQNSVGRYAIPLWHWIPVRLMQLT